MSAPPELAGSILVVDDDEDVREGLSDFLVYEGYTVTGAADGAAALRVLDDHASPDVVLLDLRMPGMDGYEFLARREADPHLRQLPVIVISATPDPDRMTFPVIASLTKPVDLDKLLDLLGNEIVKRNLQH